MGYWKNIIISIVGLPVVIEIFYIIFKKITANQNINEFLSFDDQFFDCGKSIDEECSYEFCNSHNFRKIIRRIDAAQISMDVCVYFISCRKLTDAILRAHDRGVNVRIVSQNEMKVHSGHLTPTKAEGIPMRWKDSHTIMHHKFCIIDGLHRVSEVIDSVAHRGKVPAFVNGLLIMGSMNWTAQSSNGNWESVIITNNADLLSEFQKIFNFIWEEFKLTGTSS